MLKRNRRVYFSSLGFVVPFPTICVYNMYVYNEMLFIFSDLCLLLYINISRYMWDIIRLITIYRYIFSYKNVYLVISFVAILLY